MLRNYVLLSSVYMRLLRGSHNSLEIEQRSDEMILGLGFFMFVYIFDLGFFREVGSSSRLLSYLKLVPPHTTYSL